MVACQTSLAQAVLAQRFDQEAASLRCNEPCAARGAFAGRPRIAPRLRLD